MITHEDTMLPSAMSADLHKNAKKVFVGYKINAVSEIESGTCTFQCDVKLNFQWNDEALIGEPLGKVKLGGEIFDPDVVITNECEMECESRVSKLTDNKVGTVKLSVHMKGTLFMMAMDLSTFPFDAQNLQLCLKPHKHSIEQCILLPQRDDSTIDSHPAHEWRILSHCAKEYATDPSAHITGKVFSALHMVVLVQREGGWFVNNIMIVSCGLIICAMCAFSMDSTDEHGRMNLAVLTLLAAISNKFVVGEELPKVPYRTIIDMYLDMSFFSHVFILITNVVVFYLYENPDFGWLGEGENCNYTIFVLLASAYACFHIWLLWRLNEHFLDVQAWKEESEEAGNPAFRSHRRQSFYHVAGHALHNLSHFETTNK